MNKIIFQTLNLSKFYKHSKALDGVSLTIYEGDIYGFVGENGAGKTTLIRLACGLIHPSKGEYKVFGVSNKDKAIEQVKKEVSAIVESVSVNKSLTAIDNLRNQCYLVGIKKEDEELKQIIRDVGLNPDEIINKKAGTFSLGMRQRLGLAIALISNPKFILLDEPMNGLDPQGFMDMRETILRLNKLGVTFLISSHILSELDKICTRVGFLSKGHLLEEISMDELHNKARRKIILNLNNPNNIILDLSTGLDIKDYVIDDKNIYIYDSLDINKLITFLVNNKIIINNISVNEETIEDYYRKIMSEALKT